MQKIRIVHYINQFFAQIGGEEMAHVPPQWREGPVGPGLALAAAFGQTAEIVGTVICGDSYFNEHTSEALPEILDMIKAAGADLLIAGPAFNAGRYGVACGTVAKAAQDELGIKTITGMYVENPGPICLPRMYTSSPPQLSRRHARCRQEAGAPGTETGQRRTHRRVQRGRLPARGIRVNLFEKDRGAKRAVEMLVRKLRGQDFTTEYPMPDFDRVAPQPAVKNISRAKVALVTSGGIVPFGNPDRIESSNASRYGRYDLENIMDLTEGKWATAHGGYDPSYANRDADRVLPVDVMREMEIEGKIGSLFRYTYSTVGNGTAVKSSKAFADEFVKELIKENVQAVILTST